MEADTGRLSSTGWGLGLRERRTGGNCFSKEFFIYIDLYIKILASNSIERIQTDKQKLINLFFSLYIFSGGNLRVSEKGSFYKSKKEETKRKVRHAVSIITFSLCLASVVLLTTALLIFQGFR